MNGPDRCDQLAQLHRRHAVALQALAFTYRKLHDTGWVSQATREQVRSVIAEAMREATR